MSLLNILSINWTFLYLYAAFCCLKATFIWELITIWDKINAEKVTYWIERQGSVSKTALAKLEPASVWTVNNYSWYIGFKYLYMYQVCLMLLLCSVLLQERKQNNEVNMQSSGPRQPNRFLLLQCKLKPILKLTVPMQCDTIYQSFLAAKKLFSGWPSSQIG